MASGIGEVTTPTVQGVTVRRHVLDLETGHLMHITRRIGRRLAKWLRETPDMVPGHRVIWEDGRPTVHPMLNQDGTPIMVPCLPDEMFRESYKLYSSSLLGLLKEQRERAKLTSKNGAPVISDEEAAQALREMVLDAVRSMPEDELQLMLASRRAKDAVAVEKTEGEP